MHKLLKFVNLNTEKKNLLNVDIEKVDHDISIYLDKDNL